MSAAIQPADWPNNMSADDRKVWLHEQIAKWVGDKRIEECLSALELGNLSMTEKAVAYRSVLIVGSIKHCRKHKRAEARIPILTLITYLSDNAKGTCFLSISKMQELFDRSRQCVVDNIVALEEDGLIGIARSDGMPNLYWPRIPAALVELSPNPLWVVNALTSLPKARIFGSVDEAIAAATERGDSQSTGIDQSSRVDRCQSSELDQHRSSGVDHTSQVEQTNQSSPAGGPVKSSTDSISSLNLFSSSRGGAVASTKVNGKAAMAAAMGGEAAYAERNITVTESGRLVIGDELRQELRNVYTDEQIDGAADCAPATCGRSSPTKLDLLKQLRRQCVFRKSDASRGTAGKTQPTKRTFAR
jgi:hypothetical protein